MSENRSAYFILLANRRTSEIAKLSLVFVRDDPPRVLQKSLAISTRFEDGRAVETINDPTPDGLPHDARLLRTHLPRDCGVEELLRAHRHIVAQEPQGNRVVFGTGEGEALEYLERSLLDDLEEQVRASLLWLDRESEALRPTWKGACVLTWRELWPLPWARRERARGTARKRLGGSGAARRVAP